MVENSTQPIDEKYSSFFTVFWLNWFLILASFYFSLSLLFPIVRC